MKAASLREVLNSMRKASQEEEEEEEEEGGGGGGVCSRSLATKKPYKLETFGHHHKDQVNE